MSGKHGIPVRGLMSTKSSPLFEGRFGRMFGHLPRATFGATDAENVANLTALARAMIADFDPPKDGKDDEESGIPALYTYLGQFIDHDITFDPSSITQKQRDPDALHDFRTPAFDLDNVYGRGPDDQPYLYADGDAFLLGHPIGGGSDPGARDLPRNEGDPARALIGDPRNDENAIVSQLQGLFLRFHNRLLRDHPRLEDAQQQLRFHYQYVVLNDFLPRIVHTSVLETLKTNGRFDRSKLKFFRWRNDPFLPVEFSGAAYRLGHSMIRPGYRLNDAVLLPIFPVPAHDLPEGLTGFRAMNSKWAIDWGRLIDVDTRAGDGQDAEKAARLQFAYRIDTSLTDPLSRLPASVAPIGPSSLALRNLVRGWHLGLPSGQRVARAIGIEPLKDEEILIGQGVDEPDKPLPSILAIPNADREAFAGNCPLWTYILAEAMRFKQPVRIPTKEALTVSTPRLGPVGGRIVAEVFLGLLFGDRSSMLSLDPGWVPKQGAGFALADFVRFALGR